MRYIDLFAGVGGFRYGIDRLNPSRSDKADSQNIASIKNKLRRRKKPLTCVYSNEWDKFANSVYRRNYGECDSTDIRKIDAGQLPDFDLLFGGFPCQAFSVAGKRGGFNDTRGTLFFEIARIAKEKQPRFLLLENVRGLLFHDNGRTFTVILNALDELGYDAQWQVLNSKYFGVPQNRERVYIIANLRGEPRPQVFPITRENRKNTKSSDDVKQGSQKFIKTRYLGQNGSLISDLTTLQASEIAHVIDNSYPSRTRIYTDVAPTVRDYGSGGNKMPMVNGIRRLTPIECERLQGFPDDWTKYGMFSQEISDSQRYKMMGNAVTTNVVTAIMVEFLNWYLQAKP